MQDRLESMTLSEAMKSRRKALSMTQNDLARLSGVGIATIKDIERGVANPALSNILKILDALGMEITYKVRTKV